LLRRLRPVLVLVFAVGVLHAGVYALIVPPWAYEDEQQHVDYAWSIAHTHRLPTIEDEISPSIGESVWGTDRWGNYGFPAPEDRSVAGMGLSGRSYLAYHPPGVYVAVAPLLVVVGDHATLAMYALRGVTALAAGALAVLTAVLAARLAGEDHVRRAALVGGLAVALLPSVAEAGGRFNADIFAALVVTAGVLVVRRWVDEPTPRWSWLVGLTLAVGVVTRETTVVLLVPLLVAAVVLRRRRLLDAPSVGRLLGPPLLALGAVLAVTWHATGRLVGSLAFVERYDPGLVPPGAADAVRQLGERALFPSAPQPWGAASVWLGVVVVAVIVVGLALTARAGLRIETLTVVAMLGVQGLLLAHSVATALAPITGRLLLPTYPALLAVAAVGWASRPVGAARWSLVVAGAALAVWFVAADLGPTFEWGLR
jgi:4-amino-4-deoxy-L-arabinose transferase-like glycosyltransferase